MQSARGAVAGFTIGLIVVAVSSAVAPPAHGAWVIKSLDGSTAQFQVAGQITQIVPTATGTSFVSPACDYPGGLGGTSLAIVPGRKLAGVDAVANRVVLVTSCMDNLASATNRSRLNFISATDGKVVKQLTATTVPSTGFPHFVHRVDKGDLLACGENGALFTIDYSNTTGTVDGTTAPLPQPTAATSCKGLAWDPEEDRIYQGLSVSGGSKIGRVVSFKDGTTTLLGDFTNLPCAANGLAVAGGVLFMTCDGSTPIYRLDKITGTVLGVNGTLNATGLATVNPEPGLGDLACDPVTFQKDGTGKDLFRDALWSRRGTSGNGIVALEFPAFTCALPSHSITVQNNLRFSPLAAGLSTMSAGLPAAVPRAACFDGNGQVLDSDGDGLPDCWETAWGDGKPGIDFDGDDTRDLELCVPVDTNGDGVADTTECADSQHKNAFVEIDYFEHHRPDPLALSQIQTVQSIGVQSVREAFAAAPVGNPDSTTGVRLHLLVDEQVVINPFSGPPTSHVDWITLTPCTGPAGSILDQAQVADFDDIKKTNFGTPTERGSAKALNAKRLAFRYVVFAHKAVPKTAGTLGPSGCGEVGGDDAVVSLGDFATTIVIEGGSQVSHPRGNTGQQAGTLMHEVGHLFGLDHGGRDPINCKPNYRSAMNYGHQFPGSPVVNYRLDYSRSLDPLILVNGQIDLTKTGILDEASLNELVGLGSDPSLGPIAPYFPLAHQVPYGPGAWSLATATATSINWNRSKQGPNPTYQTNASADINNGDGDCSGGAGTVLKGHNDWANLLYRFTAALDAAGGARSSAPVEMTKEDEENFFLRKDADGNGVGDALDCGGTVFPDGTSSFPCKHRIDVKPSAPFPKMISVGADANLTVAIFSEKTGNQVWNATQVRLDTTLTLTIGTVVVPVKVNTKGQGTCTAADVADPLTGLKDGIKDLKCQFDTSGVAAGTYSAVVSGFFFDPLTGEERAFTARQEVTVVP
jgi:hypothetical protein